MRPFNLMPQAKDMPITVSAAASALGRSTTWIRDHLTTGYLERDSASTPRRIMVTARSLLWAQKEMQGAPAAQGPLLRLVVDNTRRRSN